MTLKPCPTLWVLALAAIVASATAADVPQDEFGFPAYDPGRGWGLIDKEGNWTSPARYDAITPCICGVAFAAITEPVGEDGAHPDPVLIWSPTEWLPGDGFSSPVRLVSKHSEIVRSAWMSALDQGTERPAFGTRPDGIFAAVDCRGTVLGKFEEFRAVKDLPDCGPLFLRDDLALGVEITMLPHGVTNVRKVSDRLYVYDVGGMSGLMDGEYRQITPARFGNLLSFAPSTDGGSGIVIFDSSDDGTGSSNIQFVREDGTEVPGSSAYGSAIVRGALGPLLVMKSKDDFGRTTIVDPSTHRELEVGAHWPVLADHQVIIWRGKDEELWRGVIDTDAMTIAGPELVRSDVTWLWPDEMCERVMFSTSTGIGFMDTQGKTVIEPVLQAAGTFVHDHVGVLTKSKEYQVIRADGQVIYSAAVE